MKIKVSVTTNLVGSKVEDIIEVDDDSTEEEIEQDALDAMFNLIEWNWEKVED